MVELNEDLLNKKTTKIVIGILIFIIVVALIFNYGLTFYNKLRCNSSYTIQKMLNYCNDRGMILRDMKFEDGLCISVCGK